MNFQMDPALVGMLVGLALGIVSMVIVRSIARRLEEDSPTDEKRRTAGLLRAVSVVDVFLFVAIGYFVGPMVFG